jgi:DNA-binding protein HU-beta
LISISYLTKKLQNLQNAHKNAYCDMLFFSLYKKAILWLNENIKQTILMEVFMPESIGKQELIKLLSEKTKKSQKDSAEFIDAFIEIVSDSLSQDKEVSIPGFGKFYVSKRAAREGINPQTKEKIQIPATKVPLFKAGKGLKEKIK